MSPGSLMCSFNCRPGLARRSRLASFSLAVLYRVAAQIPAVQLQKVKGVEEDVPVVAAIAQSVEYRHPLAIAAHRFPINQEILHAQRGCGLRDAGKACGPINAVSSEEPDASSIPPDHHAEAIMLDFVNQFALDGALSALVGRQGWMKPGGGLGRTRYSMALVL